jgi:hypothetical protein
MVLSASKAIPLRESRLGAAESDSFSTAFSELLTGVVSTSLEQDANTNALIKSIKYFFIVPNFKS